MEQSGNGFGGFDYDPTAQGLGGGSFYDVLEHLFGAQYNGHNAPFTGFANRSGQEMHQRPSRGEDHEATIRLTLEDGARGGARTLSIPRPTGGSRKIKVKVPAGVLPGQKIRLVGQGGDCPGGPWRSLPQDRDPAASSSAIEGSRSTHSASGSALASGAWWGEGTQHVDRQGSSKHPARCLIRNGHPAKGAWVSGWQYGR